MYNKYDNALEVDVLGMMMKYTKCIDYGMEVLKDIDFYKNIHQAIFNSMKSLYIEDIEIDVTTLVAKYKSDLSKLGGISYLSELSTTAATSVGFKNKCEMLKVFSDKRKIESISNIISDMLDKGTENLEIISNVSDKIDDINNCTTNDGEITKTLESISDILQKRCENKGKITGISTGLKDLDRKINGYHPKTLTIIAGRPAMGKSTLANNMITHMVLKEGKKGILFNLEMSKDQILEKIISNLAMVDNEKIKTGNLEDKDWQLISIAQNRLYEFRDNIKVYDDIYNLNTIMAKCKKLKRQNKLDFVCVDYLQLIDPGKKLGNREQEVSYISRKLKMLANTLDTSVIALSQLSRSVEARQDKRPMLSDLRESGAIEQDADIVMFTYRDEYYNPESNEKNIMECIIAKQRNGETGTVKTAWIPRIQKVSDIY